MASDPSPLSPAPSIRLNSSLFQVCGSLLLTLLSGGACRGEERASQAAAAWVTEPEYRFADIPEQDVIFERPLPLADPVRNRVFVLEAASSQVSVWAPEGAAVLLRTGGAPGAVELIEVDGAGDTVWHRKLHFEPLKLTPRMVKEEVERIVDIMAPLHPQMSRPEVRDMFTEELHVPEHLPAAEGPPVLAASGEVWLRTFEVSDTLRTHYVVRRGEADGKPRRVLLPEWLWVADATETHVWGVWWDSMDRPHVVGRKLILPRWRSSRPGG